MTQEQLREKLKQIENLSERKEIREIYQSVFEQLALYQKEKIRQLEQQVQEDLSGSMVDYGIDMFLVTHEESRRWRDVCEALDDTRIYPPDWNQKRIKRVYLELAQHQLEQVIRQEREFHAVVKTNCDVYDCKVALQMSDESVKKINTLNKIMESNGINNPMLPHCFAERFCDVIFKVQYDKLRSQETILSVEVDWEEMTPYVREDAVLLCNVRRCQLKERIFPIPEQQEIRYKHELIPRKTQYAYLVDVSDMRNYEINRQQDLLLIKTTIKQYKKWNVYEIVPPKEWKLAGNAANVLSTRINRNIIDEIQRGKRNTRAELYRIVNSYEVSAYFDKIEIEDRKINFHVKQDTYIVRACMDMMLADMEAMYPQSGITGNLYTGQEKDTWETGYGN